MRTMSLSMACVSRRTSCPSLSAPLSFEDTAFQGQFTTENLDRIIEEYELNDGWYWTTRADEIRRDW